MAINQLTDTNCLPISYSKMKLLYRVIWRLSIGLSLVGGSVAHAADLLDINSLLSQAVHSHPLIGAAAAEEQAAREGVTAAKLNLYPTPSISSSQDSDKGLISRVNVRQPLWAGGKLTANINQSIYDDKAAVAYIFEQQNVVAKNTIDIWQSHLYATALQGLYKNNLKQLGEFEAMMRRRVEQGVSARIDLELIANRILQDQNAHQAAVQQQRIAEARLSQMIGEQVASRGLQNVPLNQMAQFVKSQSRDFEVMAFSDASINNPKVIKQFYQIESAKQKVKAEQAARYPTVYAQYEDLYYHKNNDNQGQFSLGLSYEPGAGFSNAALARASQARVVGLEQSQEAARRTVMEDIQTQYQQFVSAKDQETSLIAAVAGSQIVVDSYRRQFIAGRKTWLEVLNAVREKSSYQQQLLQVQSQMIGAFYKLQVDFGRMQWQDHLAITQPVKEYHPYLEFKDWLKQQDFYPNSADTQKADTSKFEKLKINTKNTIEVTKVDEKVTKKNEKAVNEKAVNVPSSNAKISDTTVSDMEVSNTEISNTEISGTKTPNIQAAPEKATNEQTLGAKVTNAKVAINEVSPIAAAQKMGYQSVFTSPDSPSVK